MKNNILSIKRVLNYKKIDPFISKKFYIDFYNLLIIKLCNVLLGSGQSLCFTKRKV